MSSLILVNRHQKIHRHRNRPRITYTAPAIRPLCQGFFTAIAVSYKPVSEPGSHRHFPIGNRNGAIRTRLPSPSTAMSHFTSITLELRVGSGLSALCNEIKEHDRRKKDAPKIQTIPQAHSSFSNRYRLSIRNSNGEVIPADPHRPRSHPCR